jgi:hypothetical protein
MMAGLSPEYPVIPLGQGPAKPISDQAEIDKDVLGFTNKNLHQRFEIPPTDFTYPVLSKSNSEGIYGYDLYRTVEEVTHSEESVVDEIP